VRSSPTPASIKRSDASWQCVEDAFHAYAALVFPEQHLSAAAQRAFARRFGDVELLREGRETVQITNKKPHGTLFKPEDFRFQPLPGNEGWHMDNIYMPLKTKAGVLSAIEVRRRKVKRNWGTCARAGHPCCKPRLTLQYEDLGFCEKTQKCLL
jgi:alpha-ketoglutarate-dependent taurine dioxygenase